MNHHKTSQTSQKTNFRLSQRNNLLVQGSPMQLPSNPKPLKVTFSATLPLIQNLEFKSVPTVQEKFFSPRSGKENICSPLVLSKGIKSDKVKNPLRIDNSSTFDEKIMIIKQRSEKNYRDLNKSLANLVRVPGSSTSNDDVLASKDFSVRTNLGPKLEPYKTKTFSNTLSQGSGSSIPKKSQARTPQTSGGDIEYKVLYTEVNEYFNTNSFPVKREKVLPRGNGNGGGGVANSIFSKKKGGEVGIGYTHEKGFFTNQHQRQLLTEGDVPNVRDNDFMENFSLMKKVDEKNKATVPQETQKMMGPKIFSSEPKKFVEVRNNNNEKKTSSQLLLNKNQNNEILDFNMFSDGIVYGAGGVAIHAGGKRVKQQEGESLVDGNDVTRKKDDEAKAQRAAREEVIQGETINRWRSELLEIKKDIEKRKQNFEKVNRFFTDHDENGSFVRGLNENFGTSSTTSTALPVQRNLNFTSQQFQNDPYALKRIHTQPDQTPVRQEVGPFQNTLSSKRHLIFGNSKNDKTPTLGQQQQNKKFLSDLKSQTPVLKGRPNNKAHPPINGNQGRVQTLPHYDYKSDEKDDVFLSFMGDNQKNKKISSSDAKSGCQIF